MLVSIRLCSVVITKKPETLMAAPSTSLFLVAEKLASRALIQAVTQRSNLPPSGTSSISHMASKATLGGEEKDRGSVPAVNGLLPAEITH